MAMELAIIFSDQSNSFVCGVELGRILEKMERGEDFCQNNGFPVHLENVQTLKEMAVVYGYTATFGNQPLDGWVNFIAIKKSTSLN